MVAQQWLNNTTVYLDFAACTLPTNLQTAILFLLESFVKFNERWTRNAQDNGLIMNLVFKSSDIVA